MTISKNNSILDSIPGMQRMEPDQLNQFKHIFDTAIKATLVPHDKKARLHANQARTKVI